MDVWLQNKRVRIHEAADLIGEGGEARVFRHRDLALKIFHPAQNATEEKVRRQKIEKILNFPTALPDAVIRPRAVVLDSGGNVIGYAMQAISGAQGIDRLSNRKWREHLYPANAVLRLFSSLKDVVSQLHQRRVIVGDLNDGNVLFTQLVPYLIDTDSMQFGGIPCAVGHERFLDPALYGVDLMKAPRFTEATDWYSFAVMLFSSLMYVHPYGGTHATVGNFLRRVEARHSVFRTDVVLPRLALPLKALSDDAAQWFQQVFEHDRRESPSAALFNTQWTRCSCGLEHSRAVCPDCHALGPVVTRRAMVNAGRCTMRKVFETTGRIHVAAMQGGLRYVYEENGRLFREDGTSFSPSLPPSTCFAIQGARTWAANGAAVSCFSGSQVVERRNTSVRAGQGVGLVSASMNVAYVQENEWLLEATSGARVGQVLENNTFFWSGSAFSLGMYRVGAMVQVFLVKHGAAGLRAVEGVRFVGRIIDASAVFDANHALLTVRTALDGKEAVSRFLVRDDGTLLGASVSTTVGNAALLHGRVVLATDRGLVSLKLDSGHLSESTVFTDTQPFVSAGDELLPQPDGSLYVVGPRDITQLTLH